MSEVLSRGVSRFIGTIVSSGTQKLAISMEIVSTYAQKGGIRRSYNNSRRYDEFSVTLITALDTPDSIPIKLPANIRLAGCDFTAAKRSLLD